MSFFPSFNTYFSIIKSHSTGKIDRMPFIVLNITNRCNSSCITCDYWKKKKKEDLDGAILSKIAGIKTAMHVKSLVLSGGEPLMHPDISGILRILHKENLEIKLATNGLLLSQKSDLIRKHIKQLYISLDAPDRKTYEKIRGIDGLDELMKGVSAIKKISPHIKIIFRCLVQRYNCLKITDIITAARKAGGDHISFLPAALKCHFFDSDKKSPEIIPEKDELSEFRKVIHRFKVSNRSLFISRFIIDGYRHLEEIAAYYENCISGSHWHKTRCNLPYFMCFIDTNGDMYQCCYHYRNFGSLHDMPFPDIINSDEAARFRKTHQEDPHCLKCVSSQRKVHIGML